MTTLLPPGSHARKFHGFTHLMNHKQAACTSALKDLLSTGTLLPLSEIALTHCTNHPSINRSLCGTPRHIIYLLIFEIRQIPALCEGERRGLFASKLSLTPSLEVAGAERPQWSQ